MKKTILILFLVSIYFIGFGQEKKDSLPTQKESKWSIGLSGGITYITGPQPYDYAFNDPKTTYKLKFNIDLNLNYKINRQFSLAFSTNYTQLEYEVSGWGDVYAGNRIDCLLIDHFNFFNANLMFKYRYSLKKFSINIGVGPQIGILANEYNDNYETNNQNYYRYYRYKDFSKRQTAFLGKSSVWLTYKVNNLISVFIEGSFVKSIIGIRETHVHPPVGGGNWTTVEYKYDPNYYTINLGILYKFKKK